LGGEIPPGILSKSPDFPAPAFLVEKKNLKGASASEKPWEGTAGKCRTKADKIHPAREDQKIR